MRAAEDGSKPNQLWHHLSINNRLVALGASKNKNKTVHTIVLDPNARIFLNTQHDFKSRRPHDRNGPLVRTNGDLAHSAEARLCSSAAGYTTRARDRILLACRKRLRNHYGPAAAARRGTRCMYYTLFWLTCVSTSAYASRQKLPFLPFGRPGQARPTTKQKTPRGRGEVSTVSYSTCQPPPPPRRLLVSNSVQLGISSGMVLACARIHAVVKHPPRARPASFGALSYADAYNTDADSPSLFYVSPFPSQGSTPRTLY